MSLRRADWLSLGALGLAAAASAVVFDRLPERMATHFGISGQADGWMPRGVGAFFMPVFGLLIWAVVRYLPRVLPVKGQKPIPEGKIALVASLTTLFMAFVHVVLLWVALVPGTSPMSPLWIGIGALWVALGLVMPRIGRNAFVGVRTAWTLSSDENWARTHRVAGYAMVLGGAATTLVGMFASQAGAPLVVVVLLASALVPAVYSAVLSRRLDSR